MSEDNDQYVIHEDAHMEWKIKRFLDLPKEENYCVTSPAFPLSHSKWFLLVYPNGQLSEKSAGWLGLCLKKDETDEECLVAFKMGIIKNNGSKLELYEFKWIFVRNVAVGSHYLIKRIKLTATQGIFATDGSLKFFCSARIENTKENGSQTLFPHVNPTLIDDMDRLRNRSQNADFTIKIGGEYLDVNKCILAARSPVLADMISHSMAENRSEIKIDDYDPNTFKDFIFYLYTGICYRGSSDNVLNLYKIAKEYNVMELKERCVLCMIRDLSVDWFFDVMPLAIIQHELYLIKATKRFYYEYKEQLLQKAKDPEIKKKLAQNFTQLASLQDIMES